MVVDSSLRDLVKAALRSSAEAKPASSPSGSDGSAHSLPVIWKVSKHRPKLGRLTSESSLSAIASARQVLRCIND